MKKIQNNNLFIVVKDGEQKVDIIVPFLFQRQERAAILKIILLKRDAIKDVLVECDNNSVAIKFDPKKLPKPQLFEVLNIVLKNFSEKPSNKDGLIEMMPSKKDKFIRRLVFSVEGMSCPSCALYVEMTLARDKRVISANVDFNSKRGVVVGFLDLNEIMVIIKGHGYKVYRV